MAAAGIYLFYVLYSNIEITLNEVGGGSEKSGHLVHPKELPKVKFSDVKGCDEVKVELEEFVSYLKNPSKIAKLGGRMPKGLLMIGPPGVGKTLLAKAMAGEAEVPFYYANASEFDGMFVGSGAKRIRMLYDEARKNTPCVVFLDEIDSIGAMRLMNSSSGNSYTSRDTIDQLLAALDGFKSNEGVLTIGATNFPQSLDEALTRPGRFDSKVHLPYPDLKGRQEILKLYLSKVVITETIDVKKLALNMIGFSGADISNIVNQAALNAASEGKKAVGIADLNAALDRARSGKEQKAKKYSEFNIRIITANQAGHALAGLLLGRDVHRSTMLPVNTDFGMTTLVPIEGSMSLPQIRDEIVFLMAGRAAEELLRGETSLSVYSSPCLLKASNSARNLIMNFGYSDKVGIINAKDRVSREVHALIDSESERIVRECYEEAMKLLKNHIKDLKKLQTLLREKESLSGKQIEELFGLQGKLMK